MSYTTMLPLVINICLLTKTHDVFSTVITVASRYFLQFVVNNIIVEKLMPLLSTIISSALCGLTCCQTVCCHHY